MKRMYFNKTLVGISTSGIGVAGLLCGHGCPCFAGTLVR